VSCCTPLIKTHIKTPDTFEYEKVAFVCVRRCVCTSECVCGCVCGCGCVKRCVCAECGC